MVFLALALCCMRFWCSTKMLNHSSCGALGLLRGRVLPPGGGVLNHTVMFPCCYSCDDEVNCARASHPAYVQSELHPDGFG